MQEPAPVPAVPLSDVALEHVEEGHASTTRVSKTEAYGSILENLEKATAVAARKRKFVTAMLFLLGGFTWPIGIGLGFLRVIGWLGPDFGPDGFYFACGLPGTYFMLLAVLPTDTRVIQWLHLLLALYTGSAGAICCFIVALCALGIDFDAPPARDCTPIGAGCIAMAAEWGGIGCCSLAFAVLSLRLRGRTATSSPRLASPAWDTDGPRLPVCRGCVAATRFPI